MTLPHDGEVAHTHVCTRVCARARTRVDAHPPTPPPPGQQQRTTHCRSCGDEGRRGEGKPKHPQPRACRQPPAYLLLQQVRRHGAALSLLLGGGTRARRPAAAAGGGGGRRRLALVGPSPCELCGSGRRARRYLSGAACSAAGGAGLSAPRPPGDPLPAGEMRGVSAAGGESRRGPGSRRAREGRRGGAGRGGGRKDAEEEEGEEGQALA